MGDPLRIVNFLPTMPALRVAPIYDQCPCQVLPCREHDQRMDRVATPIRRIHCAPPWRAACPPA